MGHTDLLAVATSCLRTALVGEWDITHEGSPDNWGKAVVRSLSNAVLLADVAQPCRFHICEGSDPLNKIKEVSTHPDLIIAIHWGEESYATLETLGRTSVTWRLPPEDGNLGEATIWKRRQLTTDQLEEVRAEADSELAQLLAEARQDAADELAAERSKAADELEAERSKAAYVLTRLHAKTAEELSKMRKKLALSDDLAEARGSIADEIAAENTSLQKQLDDQVTCSESLKEKLESVRTAVTEMLAENVSVKPSLLKELGLEPTAEKKVRQDGKSIRKDGGTTRKNVRKGEATTGKELPAGKKRRKDAAGNKIAIELPRVDSESTSSSPPGNPGEDPESP